MTAKKVSRVSISFTAEEIDFLAWLVAEVLGADYSAAVKTSVADKVAKAAELITDINSAAQEPIVGLKSFTDTNFDTLQAALSQLEEDCPTSWPENCEIDGLRLVCTCPACPEQYEVFDSAKKQVGYLRLRHGKFRADYPDCGGETVYQADTKGDGVFSDDERQQELTNAVKALKQRIGKNAVSGSTAKSSSMGN
jgi:hypothetical protein